MKYLVTNRGKVYHLITKNNIPFALCGVWSSSYYDKETETQPIGLRECKNCRKVITSRFVDNI